VLDSSGTRIITRVAGAILVSPVFGAVGVKTDICSIL
jgi:hypothetical protein